MKSNNLHVLVGFDCDANEPVRARVISFSRLSVSRLKKACIYLGEYYSFLIICVVASSRSLYALYRSLSEQAADWFLSVPEFALYSYCSNKERIKNDNHKT